MRQIFLFFFVSWYSFSLAQTTIELSETTLDFGDVFENAPDSLPLILTNKGNEPVNISEIRFYKTYSDFPFTIQDTGFSLQPDSSRTMYVRFEPRHNITHYSSLVIFTDAGHGALYVALEGQGKYSKTYYNTTENKAEEALKSALKSRLSQGFNSLTYNAARDAMYMTVDNQKVNGQGAAQNTLEGVYTGFTVVGYTDRQDAQFQGFNTEHTFPQGFFNQSQPMRSDLFHLFPTQQDANNQRGNLPFGAVTSNISWQNGGSKKGNGEFEPRDKQKGPVARAMFYFVIRYQDYANFLSSQEGILRQWHENFPPDDVGKKRNDDIAALQNNRNPFIDYPQFIERIHSISGNSSAPVNLDLDLTEAEIDYDTVAVMADAFYQYVLVNNGNQPLELKNINLADNSLSFTNISGNDTSILPGRGLPINIKLNHSQNGPFQSSLNFDTNVPGQSQVSIPITAELVGNNTALEELREYAFKVYPNPTKDKIYVEFEEPVSNGTTIQLIDMNGRK
ncbi:MAG: endonuclease, partial [Bacteroidetes bacterium]|nr:endonuclease [Bacteroidota bacterium]